MTHEEAKNRADRIICLDLPKDLLAIEVAKELIHVAQESGWQREALQKCQMELAWERAVLRTLQMKLGTLEDGEKK
jgi:adenylate cyclase